MSGPEPRAGQEAARLLQAAQEWLRSSAPHLAPSAPDGAPCSCPVCRAVSGLREADPDAVARWVDSAVATVGTLAAQAADLAASATRGSQDGAAAASAAADDDAGTDPGRAADPAPGSDVDPEGAREEAAAGQDGPRSRGVRRIPVDRDPGAAAR